MNVQAVMFHEIVGFKKKILMIVFVVIVQELVRVNAKLLIVMTIVLKDKERIAIKKMLVMQSLGKDVEKGNAKLNAILIKIVALVVVNLKKNADAKQKLILMMMIVLKDKMMKLMTNVVLVRNQTELKTANAKVNLYQTGKIKMPDLMMIDVKTLNTLDHSHIHIFKTNHVSKAITIPAELTKVLQELLTLALHQDL